jgi:glyceraldehyde 3-phosphate dehydrogenase
MLEPGADLGRRHNSEGSKMTVRVGINGFGRIGRALLRVTLERPGLGVKVVAVNDPCGDTDTMAFLLRHDSVMGPLRAEVKVNGGGFMVDGEVVTKLDHTEPAEIPWRDLDVDVVVESTGVFTARAKAARHLDGGARKVIVSAPSADADVTLCLGVNHDVYDRAAHRVISNASCTTNCLAPMVRVLHERFGVESGFVTTVHAYTGDQALQDVAQKSRSGKVDLRRMRAAALSIVPNTTGAAKAIGLVMPELDGRLAGMALRVPVPNGSITDLVATLAADVTADDVNRAFAEAAVAPRYRGVLRYCTEPLVSADIVGDPASCILSAPDTATLGRTVKLLGWYDNEWGYANRLAELACFVV